MISRKAKKNIGLASGTTTRACTNEDVTEDRTEFAKQTDEIDACIYESYFSENYLYEILKV